MQPFSHPIKSFCWLCIFMLLTSMMSPARGLVPQDQERMLAKLSNRNEPLRIKAIKGKKGAITVGKKFLDDDDWLKGLTFKVENISEKNIIYIQLDLEFPRSNDNSPPFVDSISYGFIPLLDGTLAADAPPPIKPGEEIELSLSDLEYGTLLKVLEESKYPKSIKQVIFNIRMVIFDDLLMWNTGRLMRRDPENPRRWVPLNHLTRISSTPNLNSIDGNPFNLNAKFLLSSSSTNSGIRSDENYLSFFKPVQDDHFCGDYTTYVLPCSSKCAIDFDARPPNPLECGYCFVLRNNRETLSPSHWYDRRELLDFKRICEGGCQLRANCLL